MQFDDLVFEENRIWTQVCEKCSQNCEDLGYLSNVSTYLICGVKGCFNEARYYLDFNFVKFEMLFYRH